MWAGVEPGRKGKGMTQRVRRPSMRRAQKVHGARPQGGTSAWDPQGHWMKGGPIVAFKTNATLVWNHKHAARDKFACEIFSGSDSIYTAFSQSGAPALRFDRNHKRANPAFDATSKDPPQQKRKDEGVLDPNPSGPLIGRSQKTPMRPQAQYWRALGATHCIPKFPMDPCQPVPRRRDLSTW